MQTPVTLAPRFEFVDFVSKFPSVAPPIILGEDTHHVFSTENEPLSRGLIEQFILPLDPDSDDYTEYVPCLAVDCAEEFVAVVWWKAGLLRYEYILATFTEKGVPIQNKAIAYTRVNGEQIQRAVATIDEELCIHIAEGASLDDEVFDPTSSRTRHIVILEDGRIGLS
jgi:hypothetical protein